MFKTILVSICLIMAAASASFANGENDKCKAAAAPVVSTSVNATITCYRVVTVGRSTALGSATCECKPAEACRRAAIDGAIKAEAKNFVGLD